MRCDRRGAHPERASAAAPARAARRGSGRVCASLALLALCLPLLPVLYVDDTAYHHVGGGTAPGRALLLYLLALALAGALWGRARAAQGAGAGLTLASVLAGRLPAVPVLAVTLMVGLNYGLFGALQGRLPIAPQTVLTLAGSPHPGAAAPPPWGWAPSGARPSARSRCGRPGWPSPPGGRAPPASLRPALALALGAGGLALLARRRAVPAGVVLGLLGLLVPASLGALVALALLGRWRAALAGVGTVAAGALLLALAAPGALPAPPGPGLAGVGRALAGTPQLQNAALGAFHARLFLGPETLAGAGPPPLSLPAFALTLGALPGGDAGWPGRAVWSARGAGPSREAVAVCLAMVAGLLLAGTTPRAQLMPAMLVLLPLGGRALTWAVAGYVLRRDLRPRPGHRGGARALRLAPAGVCAGAGAGPADPDAGARRERPWPVPRAKWVDPQGGEILFRGAPPLRSRGPRTPVSRGVWGRSPQREFINSL